MPTVGIGFVALALCLACTPVAQADLVGNTVEYRYLFPNTSTTLEGPFNAVVGPGVEFMMYGVMPIDFGNTNIAIDLSPRTGYYFTSQPFNGASFFDVFSTIDPILNVTINPATTFAPFDASRIFFDADTIRLNFESLPVNAGATFLSLDVSFIAVPEPSSTILLLGGLGCVAAYRRRKHAA